MLSTPVAPFELEQEQEFEQEQEQEQQKQDQQKQQQNTKKWDQNWGEMFECLLHYKDEQRKWDGKVPARYKSFL